MTTAYLQNPDEFYIAYNPDGTITLIPRASAGSSGGTGTGTGSGTGTATVDGATTTLQTVGNTALTGINTVMGTPADVEAPTDVGVFSIVSLIKRTIGNWTTLLARIPALVGGRIPVDIGGVTITASGGDTGAAADTVATTDTGTFSAIALIKRGLTNWTTLIGRIPVPISGRIPVDIGGATVLASSVDVGAATDVAATADTGTFSVVALIKRGLANWTTLLARIPALVSGRMPVDGSGVTQPVSAAALPLPAGAATAALQTTVNTSIAATNTLVTSSNTLVTATNTLLTSGNALVTAGNVSLATLASNVPAAVIPGLLPVDGLASVGVARQVAVGATSVNTVLTTTARRITMMAVGADMRYAIGAVAQTATTGTHWLASGERIDVRVPANANIAVMRASTTSGVLEISELV